METTRAPISNEPQVRPGQEAKSPRRVAAFSDYDRTTGAYRFWTEYSSLPEARSGQVRKSGLPTATFG